jgi:hypothetical protein
MAVSDHPYVPALSGGDRTDRSLGDAVGPSADLAAADRLVADLAALVDAGLVVVRPHVLGPARYQAASEFD